MILSKILRQRWANYATEFFTDVFFKELLQVHDRGVILAGKPSAALAFLGSAKIATVTTGRLSARAVVLPQAIFEEGLWQSHLEETAIGPQRQCLGLLFYQLV